LPQFAEPSTAATVEPLPPASEGGLPVKMVSGAVNRPIQNAYRQQITFVLAAADPMDNFCSHTQGQVGLGREETRISQPGWLN
jgi:hypothetical protein